jgi:thiol-disulfide isomerase/thioredoxin
MAAEARADRAARAAGRALLALMAAIFVANMAWVARHCEELRPITRGDFAPSVALPRVDGGGPIALADLRGQVVLVDFWATWCGPCEATLPMQKRLYEKYAAQGFTLWSVNEDQGKDAAARAARYARDKGLPFPVVHDAGGVAAELYKVDVYPTMLLIDRGGTIRQVHLGVPSVSMLEDALDEGIRSLL